MNFLHLYYFRIVAEELNITRAAKRLFISQQSLSNHIRHMEEHFNTKLFYRQPKLRLTYAGERVLATAVGVSPARQTMDL